MRDDFEADAIAESARHQVYERIRSVVCCLSALGGCLGDIEGPFDLVDANGRTVQRVVCCTLHLDKAFTNPSLRVAKP